MSLGEASVGGDPPHVSVVVATYNRSAVLRYTIESVVRQSFTSWELIVVGDACTDDTEDVVRSFGDDRIQFVNLLRRTGEQSGPNNYGAALARGKLIAFLNHDDLWLPNHLRHCWEAMLTERADVVTATGACIGARASLPLRFDDLDVALVGFFAYHRFSPVDGVESVAPASCLVFRRTAFEDLGRWRHSSEIIVEPSQDLVFRAWRRRFRIHALNVLTVVILSAGHRTGSYLSERADEAAWLFDHVVVPDRGVEMAALALETNAAFAARERRPGRSQRWCWRLTAAVGANPRSIRFRLRDGLRRGQYLDHLRERRGVPMAGGSDPSAATLRRQMVERACHIVVGETISFAAGDAGARLLASGWSRPDSEGVWNDGDVAQLAIDVGQHDLDALVLILRARAHQAGQPADEQRRADIFAGNQLLASVPLGVRFAPDLRVPLPAAAFRGSRISLTFAFTGAVSPQTLGRSTDARSLAFGLVSATIVDGRSVPSSTDSYA